MSESISQSDLEAYLDEALPAAEMAKIEQALRGNRELVRRLAAIQSQRDAGVHSLGALWRRSRLSCPSREQLGSYLLQTLPQETEDYVAFHLDVVGCRYCQANLADLQSQQEDQAGAVETRRRRYFQSSAGYLRREE